MTGMRAYSWRGADDQRYRYYVMDFNFDPEPGQLGNFVVARQDPNRWVPLLIGHGDLHEEINKIPTLRCVMKKGATHIHMHLTATEQERRYEARQLIATYPEAMAPRGCTKKG